MASKLPLDLQHRHRAGSLAWLVAALLCAALAIAGNIATFQSADDGSPADAAIVLGAAVNNGVPSPVLAARVDHGVDLLLHGRVQWLILTGGKGAGQGISEAAASALHAQKRGAPRSRLLLETRSRTTPQNLCFAAMIGSQHGVRSYLVVSDPLHLKRAMRIAERVGLRARPSATPYSRYVSWSSRLPFLLRETFYYAKYLVTPGTGC